MNYKKNIDNKEKTQRFFDYIKSNKTPIIKIVILNFLKIQLEVENRFKYI